MLSITDVFVLENKLKNNQREVAWCENSFCLILVKSFQLLATFVIC